MKLKPLLSPIQPGEGMLASRKGSQGDPSDIFHSKGEPLDVIEEQVPAR